MRKYDSEKREEMLAQQTSYKEYPFDYFFDKSQQDRSAALEEMGVSDSDDEEEEEEEEEGNKGVPEDLWPVWKSECASYECAKRVMCEDIYCIVWLPKTA